MLGGRCYRSHAFRSTPGGTSVRTSHGRHRTPAPRRGGRAGRPAGSGALPGGPVARDGRQVGDGRGGRHRGGGGGRGRRGGNAPREGRVGSGCRASLARGPVRPYRQPGPRTVREVSAIM